MVDGAAGATERPYDRRSLRSLQSLLVRSLGELIHYAYSRGYELTLGEGYVQNPRKTREGEWVNDGVHMPSSLHYVRCALDLNLFVHGEYVRQSDDAAWLDLGQFWESLDPSCSWGGRFADGNHFSVTFGGRK